MNRDIDIKKWMIKDRHLSAWFPFLVWACVIFVFAVLPYNWDLPLTVGSFDKMAHFFEFTVLSILIVRGFYSFGGRIHARNMLLTLILGGGYGILVELIQKFVPGRDASPGDVLANIAGIVFGLVLGKAIWRK
ncbi:MAG: VanZ family protein [Candidatus Omnitrophota bacterium]|nr:VanZ family protein [Candidatus Omnitrophota bacterium]